MSKINDIKKGWQNYLDESNIDKEIVNKRATICSECKHAKQGKLLTFIKDRLQEIQGYYCGLCKCPLSAKVRSETKCDIDKW
tara:strand:- start:99 stop:344 length:246 start_codon:yes stop_codon:yes gene_type:complete